jgi:hypothetical protein
MTSLAAPCSTSKCTVGAAHRTSEHNQVHHRWLRAKHRHQRVGDVGWAYHPQMNHRATVQPNSLERLIGCGARGRSADRVASRQSRQLRDHRAGRQGQPVFADPHSRHRSTPVPEDHPSRTGRHAIRSGTHVIPITGGADGLTLGSHGRPGAVQCWVRVGDAGQVAPGQ